MLRNLNRKTPLKRIMNTARADSRSSRMYRSYLQFEELIHELLQRMGRKNVEYGDLAPSNAVADIVFGAEDSKTAVEVKFYRDKQPSRVIYRRAAEAAIHAARLIGAKKSLLVIAAQLPPGFPIHEDLKDDIHLEVWDQSILLAHTYAFPDLFVRLCRLLELPQDSALEIVSSRSQLGVGATAHPKKEAYPNVLSMQTKDTEISVEEVLEHYTIPSSDSSAITALDPDGLERISLADTSGASLAEGNALAMKLLGIPAGKANAKNYELTCSDALKYLFQDDLVGWKLQSRAGGNLQIRDLICRVLPNADLWKLIANDLKSRYVVFEFKNYSKKITQHEITTTERYLYPTALRTVAFVISPKGCAQNANRVIEGAMREYGKLIIPITSEEIARLLREKDSGGDPNSYLFDLVDQFLLGLTQ